MNKTISVLTLIAAVLALGVGLVNYFHGSNGVGTATTGEITYYPGSINVTHDVAVGEALTAATIDTTGAVTSGGTVTAISTSSATYTATAAQICDSSAIVVTPLGAATTVTFPASTTLFADCLTANGQYHDFIWNSVATGTVIAAGAGGTTGYSSSLTIAAGKTAYVRVTRNATLTYLLSVINIAN